MAIVTPRYKLILTYDIHSDLQAEYMRFVLDQFVPSLQNLGLYVVGVYHTVYGNYPERQAEYACESLDTLRQTLNGERFQALEKKLQRYVTNYERKVVAFRRGFQF
jgi:hypothetical protein